jgi:hypothetical protein
MKPLLTLTIPLAPGTCRWCGCTDERACDVGCSWTDRTHTLCSACQKLDQSLRSRGGRQMLAWACQADAEHEARAFVRRK